MEGRQTLLQKQVSRVGGGSSGRWRPLAVASLASLRYKLSTITRAIVLSQGVEILDPEDFTMSHLLLHPVFLLLCHWGALQLLPQLLVLLPGRLGEGTCLCWELGLWAIQKLDAGNRWHHSARVSFPTKGRILVDWWDS